MNNINFDQLGGFPFETETLLETQKAYSIFNAYGELAGNKVIVKGCELVGNTVANGFIYVDGELLEFRGGQTQTDIIIKQDVVEVEFETKEIKPTYYERYAMFGSGLNSIPWADFKRAYPLSSALFVGKITMYVGNIEDIPWGWHLANGQNGTTDMNNSFPIQYNPANPDYDTMGKTGGLDEVTLTKGNLPSYNLSFNLDTVAEQVPSKYIGDDGDGFPDGHTDRISVGNESSYARDTEVLNIPELDVVGTISSGGSNTPLENRPAFKVVGFIQFTGQ